VAGRTASNVVGCSLWCRTGELKTPKGGKAGIAAERLEDCASKADNPNIGSGIDAGYEENEAKSEIFRRPHHGVIVVCVGRLLYVEQETIYSVLKNTLRCKCGQQNYDRAGVAITEVSWPFSP
jgi:hypothetical protein